MDPGDAEAVAKAASSTETGLRVELPAGPTPAKRQRPKYWNTEWDVLVGDEDDVGEAFHKGKKGGALNFESNKNNKEFHPFDDWNTLISLSPPAMGNDPTTVTKHVKVFFVTSGYTCPRAALGITESQMEKLMNHAKGQDSSNVTIFIPQDMREEIGIGQVLTLAKEYQNLEWQTQNLVETVATRKGEDTFPPLEYTTLNALSLLGVSPQAWLDDDSHMWSDSADICDEMEEFVFETSQSDWRYFNRDQMGCAQLI